MTRSFRNWIGLVATVVGAAGGNAFAQAIPVSPYEMVCPTPSSCKATSPVEYSGVVVEASMNNPNIRLVLRLGDRASESTVEFFGHPATTFARTPYCEGFCPKVLRAARGIKVGDTVVIQVAPRKDKAAGGYVTKILSVNGSPLEMAAAAG